MLPKNQFKFSLKSLDRSSKASFSCSISNSYIIHAIVALNDKAIPNQVIEQISRFYFPMNGKMVILGFTKYFDKLHL